MEDKTDMEILTEATKEQLPKDSPHVTFHSTWVTGLDVVSWKRVPAEGPSVLALGLGLGDGKVP